MRRTLDLDSLKSLVAGVSLGTFSKAAAKVGRSPSTISMQMQKLEAQLCTPILRKAGRGLVLTPAGEIMVEYARRLLDLNDEALNVVRDLKSRQFPQGGTPNAGRPKRAPPPMQTVEADDWPETLPVTEQTLALFEIHLADALDELLGPLPERNEIPLLRPALRRKKET